MSEKRPWWISLGWIFRDYLKRIWDNAAEDNVLFLAGGIAFNILIAAIPFFLLLVSGLIYLMPAVTDVTPDVALHEFIDRFLPLQSATAGPMVHGLIDELLKRSGTFPVWSALLFAWLSTRLFGSLRSALADVFDIEHERSIIRGKIFDFQITLVSTILFVASTMVTTYIAIATTRGSSRSSSRIWPTPIEATRTGSRARSITSSCRKGSRRASSSRCRPPISWAR